ncbi:hypothetical protein [Pseudonocardia sp. GCM10023141]|uniref:hypothetical protein n=1 Tax=Pseudonocardia sp. GCM10023141 TaxID=3252653 RepID=UPI003618741B
MARTGRPVAKLALSDEERQTLRRWARRPKCAQALALGPRSTGLPGHGVATTDLLLEATENRMMGEDPQTLQAHGVPQGLG